VLSHIIVQCVCAISFASAADFVYASRLSASPAPLAWSVQLACAEFAVALFVLAMACVARVVVGPTVVAKWEFESFNRELQSNQFQSKSRNKKTERIESARMIAQPIQTHLHSRTAARDNNTTRRKRRQPRESCARKPDKAQRVSTIKQTELVVRSHLICDRRPSTQIDSMD
jgi:hypothetical protein